MAVIAADALDDFVPTRGGSGQPDGAHDRFGAGGDEAHLLEAINATGQQGIFGGLDFKGTLKASNLAMARPGAASGSVTLRKTRRGRSPSRRV